MSDAGLQELATWADGIGPDKTTIINYDDATYPSTGLLEKAHSYNLYVRYFSSLFRETLLTQIYLGSSLYVPN